MPTEPSKDVPDAAAPTPPQAATAPWLGGVPPPRGADTPSGRRTGVYSDPDFRRPSEVTGAGEGSQAGGGPGDAPVPVRDVMTGRVEVVRPDDTLQVAAEKMRGLDVGLLPVVDGERVVGVLTDRDITVRAAAAGLDPTRVTAGDAMTADVESCYADEDVGEVGRRMREKQVRRLLVLDRSGRLAGIVSLGDLALGGGDDRMSGDTLRGISDPHP